MLAHRGERRNGGHAEFTWLERKHRPTEPDGYNEPEYEKVNPRALSAIRRYSRCRSVILFIMLTAVIGTPIANIKFRIPVDVFLCLFFGIPILGFISAYFALHVLAVRCRHAEAFLGTGKKKFYDVIATGRCRKCEKSVIDGVA